MTNPAPRAPRDLRVRRALEILPATPELEPFVELLVASSVADPGRRWSASGELGSVGDRLVDARALERGAGRVAAEEARHTERLLRRTAVVVGALARDDHDAILDALLEQGAEEEELGRASRARAWYRAGVGLAREWGHPRTPEALRRAARAARNSGELEEAATAYEEAWAAARELGLEDDAIIAATGRGNVEVDHGRWHEAEGWYRRALEVVGEEGPPRRERWQLHQNLAIVRRRLGDLEGARRRLELARAEGEALDDPDARVEVSNGMGQLLLAEGDPAGAEALFRAALEEASTPKARVTIGVNLGEALLARGRDLEAGEVAREAEAVALARGVHVKLPELYRLLAAVAMHRGEQDGYLLLERALEVIRARRLPPWEEAQTLRALARAAAERGEDERAHELEARAGELLGEESITQGDANGEGE